MTATARTISVGDAVWAKKGYEWRQGTVIAISEVGNVLVEFRRPWWPWPVGRDLFIPSQVLERTSD